MAHGFSIGGPNSSYVAAEFQSSFFQPQSPGSRGGNSHIVARVSDKDLRRPPFRECLARLYPRPAQSGKRASTAACGGFSARRACLRFREHADQVLTGTLDPGGTSSRLARVILKDLGLASQILRLGNSRDLQPLGTFCHRTSPTQSRCWAGRTCARCGGAEVHRAFRGTNRQGSAS